MPPFGRIAGQVQMNILITFYKKTPAAIMMQGLHHSFNAVGYHSNRLGSSKIPNETLAVSYKGATAEQGGLALAFNGASRTLPSLFGRFVPVVAVAARNALILVQRISIIV